jgi:hypothetical protein
MSGEIEQSAVLMPAGPGRAGEAARKRLDRRHLLTALAAALLLHALVVLGFLLYDLLRVRDIGDWSGPVLVKIGAPEALESPLPDPGPLPEEAEEAVPSESAEPASEPTEDAAAGSAVPEPERAQDAARSEMPRTDGTGTAEAESAAAAGSAAPSTPQPARVQGSENGNNYLIDFEGSEGEVGRAAAYDYITSYMPLPETLPLSMVEGASDYLGKSPAMIRSEIEAYWEPVFGEYVKKRDPDGIVPYRDRPYYWGILVNALGYDIADADWRVPGMRPVEVEFTVKPSSNSRGSELEDIEITGQGINPRVDEAVLYGLSQWVYYNKTDRDIKARITYDFAD